MNEQGVGDRIRSKKSGKQWKLRSKGDVEDCTTQRQRGQSLTIPNGDGGSVKTTGKPTSGMSLHLRINDVVIMPLDINMEVIDATEPDFENPSRSGRTSRFQPVVEKWRESSAKPASLDVPRIRQEGRYRPLQQARG
jgi:hypothetical protein